jgi:predicted adenylyl cyclase CyaB
MKLRSRKIKSGMEFDRFYDLESSLRERGCILRLRRSHPKGVYLTFKGPRSAGLFKKRLEAEVRVNDERAAERILKLLGFRMIASYSKRREEFKLGGTVVTLDFLAGIGWFAEVEGSKREIITVRKKLGICGGDLEQRSYLQIVKGIRERYAS